MTETKKQLDSISEQLDQMSSQIKRFIIFVNSHKKPTSEQQENFNGKAVQFLNELNKISNTIKEVKQDKNAEIQLPKFESTKNQLLTKVSTLTDKLNKLDKKIGIIDVNLLTENEDNQGSKIQDPESTISTTINTKNIKLNENEDVRKDEEEQVSKKTKDKKTKHEPKSVKTKNIKHKNTKESNDSTTTTTVVAQIHADHVTGNEETNDDNDDGDDIDKVDAKHSGKILKRAKSSKKLKISGKKSKPTEDENETSKKRKKKSAKKHDTDKSNKSNNAVENTSSSLKSNFKLQDDKDKTGISEVETDEKEQEELEVEDEESEAKDNINQVQPFHNEECVIEGNEERLGGIAENISSQSVLQVNSEISKNTQEDKITDSVDSIKKDTSDVFYHTIRQWIGDDEDDLSFISGETLKILEKDDDGWWLGENIQGKQGLVPMNFLKKIVMVESEWQNLKLNFIKQKNVVNTENIQTKDSPQTYSDYEEVEEEEEEEMVVIDDEEAKLEDKENKQQASRDNTKVMKANITNQVTARTQDSVEYSDGTWEYDEDNYNETDGNFEIEEQEHEDDTFEEDNNEDNVEEKVNFRRNNDVVCASKSFVPTPLVDTEQKLFKDDQDFSGWYIKNNEKPLEAYQPLPSSVRLSFLSLPGLKVYNYQKFLSPKLGSSHLIFTDLLLDMNNKKITRRQARWQKIITLQKISQLSLLEETNFSILNHSVCLCLFDGKNPISNICCLPITPTDREKKTWIVTPHNIKKSEKSYELSSDLFVRYNEQNMNIFLLIEIQIVITKQNSNKPIELSLGWVTIPLYDENGQIISNKTCDYPLQDSLPFENGKTNKTSIKDVSLRSRMQSLLFNKTVQLTIRFSQPNKEQQDKLDSLPDILIGLMSYVPFLSYHRDFLANIFPGFGGTNDRFVLRHVHPEVALFPIVADCPLLIECLRVSWQDRLKEIPVNQKKDTEYLRKLYSDHFRRVIYPLLWLQDIRYIDIMSSQQFEVG
ncbi:Nephrocystin-1 [Schistosoma japonicum]|uniref:Nephrocystin-1 n=1 Tax=Schistosoma japonicum TaxID=6182 RepID=A0A4Z2D4G7_SCHJA|nr:Nephrocystin-1 [Schistosoma japonicum]